jgi:hypothetical protein
MAGYEPYLSGTVAEAYNASRSGSGSDGSMTIHAAFETKPHPMFREHAGLAVHRALFRILRFCSIAQPLGRPWKSRFDLLDFLAKNLWGECRALPEFLRASSLPLPAHVRRNCGRSDISTISLIQWASSEFEANGQSPPGINFPAAGNAGLSLWSHSRIMPRRPSASAFACSEPAPQCLLCWRCSFRILRNASVASAEAPRLARFWGT